MVVRERSLMETQDTIHVLRQLQGTMGSRSPQHHECLDSLSFCRSLRLYFSLCLLTVSHFYWPALGSGLYQPTQQTTRVSSCSDILNTVSQVRLHHSNKCCAIQIGILFPCQALAKSVHSLFLLFLV